MTKNKGIFIKYFDKDIINSISNALNIYFSSYIKF